MHLAHRLTVLLDLGLRLALALKPGMILSINLLAPKLRVEGMPDLRSAKQEKLMNSIQLDVECCKGVLLLLVSKPCVQRCIQRRRADVDW